MKLLIIFIVLASQVIIASAQQPVQWEHTATKLSDNTYKIQFKATIKVGWHIYAQKQAKNFIGTPTQFSFTKNPLLKLSGLVTEEGKLEKKTDKSMGIEQRQYAGTVSFIQVVNSKANIKTNVLGTITYQACTDEKCLLPQIIKFDIPLNNE